MCIRDSRHRGPWGRNKQSSDNGTCSCSPIRYQCERQALEHNKPQMVSDTRIFLSTAKQPFSIPDGPGVLALLSSYSVRTVPCSCSRMCWRHQQGFSNSSASRLVFFLPVAQVAQAGVHSHEILSMCHPLMLPSEQSSITTLRTNGCGAFTAALQSPRSTSLVQNVIKKKLHHIVPYFLPYLISTYLAGEEKFLYHL